MQSSQRQVLNGLSLNTLSQRNTGVKKAYDTQTVLQLIYQQQQQQENSQSPAQQQAAQRYKTELCRTFQENGICKYGDKCQFAHGLAELRTMSRHPKYKTELCRTFHASGYCPYGPRCHFVHDTEADTRSVKSQELTVKLNNYSSSSSSSSSSSGSTSPLSLNGFSFDLNNELDSIVAQNNIKKNSSNLLMCANEFNYVSERKSSVSSESVFSSDGLSSPPSSRSLSPDFLFNNQTKKFYDDWEYSGDSIVNQILNNVVQLDENEDNDVQGSDLTLNYLNLLI